MKARRAGAVPATVPCGYRESTSDRIRAGAFVDEPLELLEGFLVEMSPDGAEHVYASTG